MNRSNISLCVLILAMTPAHAEPVKSIVGLWSPPETRECSLDAGATRIGPKSLKNLDITCRFDTVQRRGNTVIWKGQCDDAEGSSDQTVTATLRNDRLRLSYSPGGNVIENLKRCR